MTHIDCFCESLASGEDLRFKAKIGFIHMQCLDPTLSLQKDSKIVQIKDILAQNLEEKGHKFRHRQCAGSFHNHINVALGITDHKNSRHLLSIFLYPAS